MPPCDQFHASCDQFGLRAWPLELTFISQYKTALHPFWLFGLDYCPLVTHAVIRDGWEWSVSMVNEQCNSQVSSSWTCTADLHCSHALTKNSSMISKESCLISNHLSKTLQVFNIQDSYVMFTKVLSTIPRGYELLL